MPRHFLELSDAGSDGLAAILSDATARKAARSGQPEGRVDADAPLQDRVLAMIFEKVTKLAQLDSFDS